MLVVMLEGPNLGETESSCCKDGPASGDGDKRQNDVPTAACGEWHQCHHLRSPQGPLAWRFGASVPNATKAGCARTLGGGGGGGKWGEGVVETVGMKP